MSKSKDRASLKAFQDTGDRQACLYTMGSSKVLENTPSISNKLQQVHHFQTHSRVTRPRKISNFQNRAFHTLQRSVTPPQNLPPQHSTSLHDSAASARLPASSGDFRGSLRGSCGRGVGPGTRKGWVSVVLSKQSRLECKNGSDRRQR